MNIKDNLVMREMKDTIAKFKEKENYSKKYIVALSKDLRYSKRNHAQLQYCFDNKTEQLDTLKKKHEQLVQKFARIGNAIAEVNRKEVKPQEYKAFGKSFDYADVLQIAKAGVNIGMSVRQNQLNGSDTRSGNEILSIVLNTHTLDKRN